MARRSDSDPRLLTEAELDLMQALWDQGEATVHDLMAALPPERGLAYTTVSTVVRILESKGIVAARKEGRQHIYSPLLSRQEHADLAVRHLMDRVFEGAAAPLVARLIDVGHLEEADLEALRALLASAGARGPREQE